MEEHNVLDDLEERPEEPFSQRQRSFRFMYYALGIVIVLIGRIWLHNKSAPVGADLFDSIVVRRLFSLGVAGVWLFAGLGSLAAIRTVMAGERDFLLIIVLLVHLVVLLLSSWVLIVVVAMSIQRLVF